MKKTRDPSFGYPWGYENLIVQKKQNATIHEDEIVQWSRAFGYGKNWVGASMIMSLVEIDSLYASQIESQNLEKII